MNTVLFHFDEISKYGAPLPVYTLCGSVNGLSLHSDTAKPSLW